MVSYNRDPHKPTEAIEAIAKTIAKTGFWPYRQLTSSVLCCQESRKRVFMRIRPFSVEHLN